MGLDITAYDAAGTRRVDFKAGSYSGYNAWRDSLSRIVCGQPARAVWEDPDIAGDFQWIINFSDCEGTIKSDKCALLAEAFQAKREHVLTVTENAKDTYFMAKYDQFLEAFQVARDGGRVRFH